jgi:hypothetical protein
LRRGKAEGGNAIDYAIVFLEDEADNLANTWLGPALGSILKQLEQVRDKL